VAVQGPEKAEPLAEKPNGVMLTKARPLIEPPKKEPLFDTRNVSSNANRTVKPETVPVTAPEFGIVVSAPTQAILASLYVPVRTLSV
jgi:hypothetical protein